MAGRHRKGAGEVGGPLADAGVSVEAAVVLCDATARAPARGS